MSQLTRTTWDSTYNNNSSGPFKTNSTQAITEPVMQAFSKDAEDSLAFLTDVNQFLSKQNIGITSAGVVADASILGLKSYFQTSDASIFHINGYFQTQQNVATSNSIQGLEAYTTCVHPSGTVALAIGLIGNIEMASAFTLTTARSVQAGGQSSAAGTVTEWDLFYGNLANSASATYTTVVGLKIDTFPTATNKYGIIIVDTAAKSGFGTSSPTATIEAVTASNTTGVKISGNTTSNVVSDLVISKSGAANNSVGQGACILLSNSTSTKGIFIQGSDDIFQIFGFNGSSATERIQMNASGAFSFSGGGFGTSGYFLKSNGSGSAPSWTSVSTITNSGVANELVKSDGTNIVGTGLSSTFANFIDTGSGAGNINFRAGTTSNYVLIYVNQSFNSSTAFPLKIHSTNSSPSTGAGVGFQFETEVNGGGGVYKIGSTMESVSTNVGVGTEVFDIVLKNMNAGAAASEKMRITGAGNIYGTSGTTGMNDGFFYIPSAAGAPSGTPTSISAHVPMYYDTTNNKFYIYNGAWKQVALT